MRRPGVPVMVSVNVKLRCSKLAKTVSPALAHLLNPSRRAMPTVFLIEKFLVMSSESLPR